MSASTTATEEDTEQLRDLVAATLEKEGILGKIKAQLRSQSQCQLHGNLYELKMFNEHLQGPCVSFFGRGVVQR